VHERFNMFVLHHLLMLLDYVLLCVCQLHDVLTLGATKRMVNTSMRFGMTGREDEPRERTPYPPLSRRRHSPRITNCEEKRVEGRASHSRLLPLSPGARQRRSPTRLSTSYTKKNWRQLGSAVSKRLFALRRPMRAMKLYRLAIVVYCWIESVIIV